MSWRGLAALMLSVPLLLASCGQPLVTPEPTVLRVAGATSLEAQVTGLEARFHELWPTASLQVEAHGTMSGLAALAKGEAEVAMASWLPEDIGCRCRATAVARDGIAIIVHPHNRLAGLGLVQLRDLYSGSNFEWAAIGASSALGEVQPVSREDGSGTRAGFEALVMEGHRVTPRAVIVASGPAMVRYVAEHEGAIGYVSMGQLSGKVRALAIEGTSATSATVRDGSYPLSHEMWLVTADPPAQAVRAFIEFALSPAGQQLLGRRFALRP